MKRARVLIPIVLVVVLGVFVWDRTRFGSGAAPKARAEVAPESRVVAGLGRIRPDGDLLEVGADVSRRVARLLVQEGQTVKKGDVLAYLDNHDELVASANYAESQYEGGKDQLKYRSTLEQANIEKAEAELKSVQQLAPQGIQVQEYTAEKCRIELDLAKKEAKRLERLVEKGSASREELERKNTEMAQRTKQLDAAESELARLKAAFPLDEAKAKAVLESARANLKYVAASVDVPSLKKNLDLARARVESSVVRAPVDGYVLRIRTRPGETVKNTGVVTLGDLKTMWVVAEVYENELRRVREGQTAKITAAALAEPLTGRVVRVGRLINRQTVFDLDPAAVTDARVAEVHIRLDRAEAASALVNLQVTALIDVDPSQP